MTNPPEPLRRVISRLLERIPKPKPPPDIGQNADQAQDQPADQETGQESHSVKTPGVGVFDGVWYEYQLAKLGNASEEILLLTQFSGQDRVAEFGSAILTAVDPDGYAGAEEKAKVEGGEEGQHLSHLRIV